MAARVPPPEPARPLPAGRRAIFFDVENTSRAEHIARVLAHLAVDRVGRRTDFFAVGNWRVIGHDTARLLARHGAGLVHSAPSVGVRDWSDLRIAVASGVWLAGARPGDVIEIVSDDRAFDAVGDVAASLGVTFRRLSYRALLGMPTQEPVEVERVEREYGHGDRGDRGGRRRRRGGRGRGRGEHGAPRPVHQAPVDRAPRAEPVSAEEPHTAPHDEIVNVVQDLARARGTVTLDSLANALKSRGFSRPPGSPRLITRLRRIKELDVNRAGVITLVGDAAAPAEPETPPAVARRSRSRSHPAPRSRKPRSRWSRERIRWRSRSWPRPKARRRIRAIARALICRPPAAAMAAGGGARAAVAGVGAVVAAMAVKAAAGAKAAVAVTAAAVVAVRRRAAATRVRAAPGRTARATWPRAMRPATSRLPGSAASRWRSASGI